MLLPNYPIFGQSNYKGITPSSWNGQGNFYAVPPGMKIWTDEGGQIWATPNPDTNEPRYACMYDYDGSLKFQSLVHSAIRGTLSSST